MKTKVQLFSMVCCIVFYACNNSIAKKTTTICKHWQLTRIENIKDTLQLSNALYRLSFKVDSSFSFNIEDNVLNGNYSTKENTLQFNSTIVTDVCCNSTLGKLVESIFSATPLHYSLINDSTLLLHAVNEKAVLKFVAVK